MAETYTTRFTAPEAVKATHTVSQYAALQAVHLRSVRLDRRPIEEFIAANREGEPSSRRSDESGEEPRSGIVLRVRAARRLRLGGEADTHSATVGVQVWVADPDAGAVRVEADYDVVFSIQNAPTEFDDDTLTAFCRINGVYTAYPYLRALVEDLLARMYFPALPLPLIPPQRVVALAELLHYPRHRPDAAGSEVDAAAAESEEE